MSRTDPPSFLGSVRGWLEWTPDSAEYSRVWRLFLERAACEGSQLLRRQNGPITIE